MKVLDNLEVSGSLGLGSTKKDTFTIGSSLENTDVNVDNLVVYANADFKNNVTLGSSSVDVVNVKGQLSASSGISASFFTGNGSGLTNIGLSPDITSSNGQIIINSEIAASGGIDVPAPEVYKLNNKTFAKWNEKLFTATDGTTYPTTGSRIVGADFSDYGSQFADLGGLYFGRTNLDYMVGVVEADYIKLRTDYTYATPAGIDIVNGNGPSPTNIVIDNKSNGGDIAIKTSGNDSYQKIILSSSVLLSPKTSLPGNGQLGIWLFLEVIYIFTTAQNGKRLLYLKDLLFCSFTVLGYYLFTKL